ncbi:MAG TPA: LLM class flavin-dependent oxidoreductase [Acidimicrobiales bacterium]|jgi:alkanesulfonate monooxygenase SsuD/methylene tetrahydromethanopterin reductase-like flavin-dependent oxidoreductase (luciferase family)|nr:LLM class flavin-dependent oxidoreductase [Acidimicrobiales bacterium]
MTHYHDDLLFGTFITPTSEQPHFAVALAQASEQLGLDLVTFQDHPYLPTFLDTWSLIAFVLAQTTRITAAPNVANLPLRTPAVLARSAASLDLLSNGRLALGLGAGAFWDGIVAMGGQRLTPKQSVKALDEAIEVIRGMWDDGAQDALHVEGEHYHVHGAQRGPRPAHDIPIWLGAYKPAMLALTGRGADGWLPSLGYIQPDDIAGANAIIDDAALAAGRDPREIRRMLNVSGEFTSSSHGFLRGPTAQWVEQLGELALTDGISTFILGSDDVEEIERFAEEVVPALREFVAVELKRPTLSAERDVDARDLSNDASSEPSRVNVEVTGQRDDVARQRATSQYERLGVFPTPDSGERLSKSPLWDESTRPRRPESPPDVVYSDTGRAVGSHLIDVHDHLRGELEKIRGLMDEVRGGSLNAQNARDALNEMTIRQNDWTLGAYCATYCRMVAVHHGLEDDAIFPHLRSCEADLEPVIDRLIEEHEVIHDVLDRVDQCLVDLVATPGDFSALQSATDVLTDTLLSHLAYEERELVEPLARYGFYKGQVR